MKKFLIVQFLALLAIAIRSGDAIHCYVCNSGSTTDGHDGDACKDPASHKDLFVKDCDMIDGNIRAGAGNYTLCRKFVQDVEGDYRIVRSCATAGREGRCIDRTGTAKIKLQYCECRNEHDDQPCNGAVAMTGVVGRTMLGLAAVVTLVWHAAL